MRTIWKLAMKDIKILSRDKATVFFVVGFPLLIGIFFGVVMGGPGNGSKSSAMKIAIVDEDNTAMSKRFISQLDQNDGCDTVLLARDEAINQVRKGKLTGMIAIPDGFGETAGVVWQSPPEIQVGMDPSRQAEGAMAQGFIMQAMGNLIGDRMFDPKQNRKLVDDLRSQLKLAQANGMADANFAKMVDSMDTLFDSINKMDEASPAKKEADSSSKDATNDAAKGDKVANESPPADPSEHDDGNGEQNVGDEKSSEAGPSLQFANITSIDVTRVAEPGSQSALLKKVRTKWDLTFPQAMVWGILGCVASFAISIVRERIRGTYQRLEVAPFSKMHIVAGKGLACFLTVIFVIAMLLAVGFFLGLRPCNPAMLAVATIFVSFCFVGIMLVISVLGKTEEIVGGAGWGVNMVMAMFGGGMIPLMFLPKSIQTISNLSPVKWAILALEGAIWRGFSIAEMMLPLTILFCVGAACILIGSWRLNAQTG